MAVTTTYFLLKVKGQEGRNDSLQIRDENLSLLLILLINPSNSSIVRFFKEDSKKANKVLRVLEGLPYGILKKIEI
jgi:hypothetical protein